MFEEVPRSRSGLAGLTARRIVLGPFVIGGGVLLATIGGSVAVAATVFTASAMHVNNGVPRHIAAPLAVATTSARHTAAAPRHTVAQRPVTAAKSPTPVATHLFTAPPPVTIAAPQTSASAVPATSAVVPTENLPLPTPVKVTKSLPAPTRSNPVGNALIYLSDYNAATKRLTFSYAEQLPNGADGTPTYQVSSPRQFTAGLADTVVITSGGTVCGQAGSVCTPAELIAAVQSAGLFASVGVGPGGVLQSVVELPDHSGASQINPPPAPTTAPPTATPSATPTPSATSTG